MFVFDFIYQNKLVVNYLIMSLYVLNILAGVFHKDAVHSWYWVSAFSITACVTWGYAK